MKFFLNCICIFIFSFSSKAQCPGAPIVNAIVGYCQNETASPLTATGTNLLWYTTSTGGVGTTVTPTPITTTTGSVDYFVSQTANSCESPRATITVKVTALPSAPTVPLGAIYRCGPGPVTLSASAPGIVKWYSDAALANFIQAGSIFNVNISNSTTFYVTNTEGNCVSPSKAVTASVLPLITQVTNFSYDPAVVCMGSPKPVPIPVAGFTMGGGYSSTPGLSLNPNTGIIDPAASTPGTYTIKYSLGASICAAAASSTTKITISTSMTSITGFYYSSPVCSNGQNLAPAKVAGFTPGGIFSSTPGLSIDATTGLVDVKASSAGTYTISYTCPASACNTGGSSKSDITINASPTAPVVTGDKRCGNGVVNLNAGGTGTLKWYNAPELKDLVSTGTTYSPAINMTTDYYVTESNGSCTSDPSVVTGVILAIPPKPDLGNLTPICPGDRLDLRPGIYDNYLWQDNTTSSSYTVTSPGVYTLTVKSVNGCSNSVSISIDQSSTCTDIMFPTAFSPNGDHLNDNFGPMPVRNLSYLKNYTLRIFNRYGQVVFSSTNPYEKWDGYYHGQPGESGNFIWQATYIYNTGNKKVQEGHVAILR